MKNFQEFAKLANETGELVGAFSGHNFQETLNLLEELAAEGAVRFEFGRKGDTVARAYWEDVPANCSGCVSIYAPIE